MKKINSSDLFMILLILVFVNDLDYDRMSAMSWTGAAISLIWLVLFAVKLFSFRKGG